jgi:hypothetical protein
MQGMCGWLVNTTNERNRGTGFGTLVKENGRVATATRIGAGHAGGLSCGMRLRLKYSGLQARDATKGDQRLCPTWMAKCGG